MIVVRLVETVALALASASVVPMLVSSGQPWWMAIGALVLVTVTAISTLSCASLALRALVQRLRGRHDAPVTPALELVAGRDAHRYVIVGFLTIVSLLMLAAMFAGGAREPVLLIVPALPALPALLLATWTYTVRIDGEARRLARVAGARCGSWTLPFRITIRDVPADARVELAERFRSTGKNGGYHVHELTLVSTLIFEHRDADIARLHAEQVAKLLAITLHDQTCVVDPDRARAADELDVTLATQLSRRGTATRPAPPPGARLAFEADDTPWIVTLRPRGLGTWDVVGGVFLTVLLLAPSFIPAAIVAAIAGRFDREVILPLAVATCAVASWFGLWRMMLHACCETQRIELSPARLRVTRRAPGHRTQVHELPSELVEELVITPNRERGGHDLRVVARCDRGSLAFGHGLGRADAIWLREAALAALAPPRSLYR